MKNVALRGLALGSLVLLAAGCAAPDEEESDSQASDLTHCAGGFGNVVGAIEVKYRSLGGCSSFLGVPRSDERPTADGRGRYSVFEFGSIYWRADLGAHEVHGAVRNKWSDLNWENGVLGYPLTDELTPPDGRGRYAVFEGGSIYWTSTTGAHEVRGAIRDAWRDLGWEQGALGYPTTGEHDVFGGRRSKFEHGSITWSRATGKITIELR